MAISRFSRKYSFTSEKELTGNYTWFRSRWQTWGSAYAELLKEQEKQEAAAKAPKIGAEPKTTIKVVHRPLSKKLVLFRNKARETGFSLPSIRFRQTLPEGTVVTTTTEGQPAVVEEAQQVVGYHKYKATVTWFSGGDSDHPSDRDYGIRWEIFIIYYVRNDQPVDRGMAEEWLDRACHAAFGRSLSEVRSWHNADANYTVPAIDFGADDGYVPPTADDRFEWWELRNDRTYQGRHGFLPK